MTPGKSNIDQLFNGTRVFEIPFYQRSYVWDKTEWERFLTDMINVGQQNTNYFLGAIILKQVITGAAKRGDYKVVIDGQQRLTTLAIFLKVLYLKQDMNQWYERKFILPDGCYAIQHSRIDREDFQKVITLTSCDALEGESNIIRAYNYFREYLDPTIIDENKLKYNVQVIDIVIDNDDDEQQIFDTINSLGVDLTTAELLKNHLFTEQTLPQYNQLWAPVFEYDEECISFWAQPLLKGRNKQVNIEAFLNAFLQIKVHDADLKISTEEKLEYAKSTALFYSYKKFIADHWNGREFKFVEELVNYAKVYRESFNPNIIHTSLTSSPGIERINFLIFATDGTSMIPFVMFIINNVSDIEERNKIFDYLESYYVRRLICKSKTNSYSDLFSESLINANITTADQLIAYINGRDESAALSMPNNAELLRNCKETEFPNNRGLAILYLLESRLRSNANLLTQLLPYSSYSLEHLMPQKWINNWPLADNADADTRNHVIKTLGNFTLLTQKLNASISNSSWSVKVNGRNNKEALKTYANGLLTLAGVLDINDWNENTINARSIWIACKASKVWPSQLTLDTTIEEPIITDNGEIIIDEDSGEERVNTKDHTKYSLDGDNFMGKSHFVPYFIKQYIKKHKEMTYKEIKEKFPDSLMESGFVFQGLICPVDTYEKWDNQYKERRYRANDSNNKLKSSDGVEFYVNTQWTADSVQNIIQIAKDDHWKVMIEL